MSLNKKLNSKFGNIGDPNECPKRGGTPIGEPLGPLLCIPVLAPGGRLDIYTTTPTEKKFGFAGLTYAIAQRFILILLVPPLIDSVSAKPGMRLNCENEVYST